jgi:hypothetical protein
MLGAFGHSWRGGILIKTDPLPTPVSGVWSSVLTLTNKRNYNNYNKRKHSRGRGRRMMYAGTTERTTCVRVCMYVRESLFPFRWLVKNPEPDWCKQELIISQ